MKRTRRTVRRLLILGAALLLTGRIGRAEALQAGSTAEEKRPNVLAPLSQFGTRGTGKGQLAGPRAVAVSPTNRIYVADTGNHRVQVFLSDGTAVAGWGKRGDGPAEFLFPAGIAVGPTGEIFVSDTGNGRIQVFDGEGLFRRQWSAAGAGAIAVSETRVAVAESDASLVRLFTPDGEAAGSLGGFGDGPGEFKHPSGVAWDAEGNLVVADAGNHRIQKLERSGKVRAQWGTWGLQEGLFSDPTGVAFAAGRVYVSDGGNHRVQVFDESGAYLYQWGRAPVKAFQGEGRLHLPAAIAVSPAGGLTVVCEPVDHRCQVFANGSVRQVTPANDLPWWDNLHVRMHQIQATARAVPSPDRPFIAPVAPVLGGVVDAEAQCVFFFNMGVRPPAFAARAGGFGRKLGEFAEPAAVAVDSGRSRAYVSDRGHRRIQLLELSPSETSATGFAPAPKVIAAIEPARMVPSSVEGYRPEISSIEALALDPASGNLLAADGPNSTVLIFDPKLAFVRALRRPADGGRKPSRWTGVASSPDGKRTYVVDGRSFEILAFDATGAPDGGWGLRGVGPAQEFHAPVGVAVDGKGFVYVTDRLACTVRKFDAAGLWTATWGGPGKEWGMLSAPGGISFWRREGDVPDRIVVDDVGNHRAQMFTTDGKVYENFVKGGSAPPPPAK